MKTLNFLIMLSVLLLGAISSSELDKELEQIILNEQLEPARKVEKANPDKVELGRKLFFDKLLSGNKDVSCATCHHPNLHSGDELALSIGVGGDGLGESRNMGKNRFRIPRNSPEIFNRDSEEWHTLFWDGRVSITEEGFDTPADEKLPDGLENVLAAQAMFPVVSRDEMRGLIGDNDIDGNLNELALISDARPQSVWRALMERILGFEEYREMFAQVYPHIKPEDLGFQHAANAIAAFEMAEFTFTESPWDQYLSGNINAISDSTKRGAILFYGKANCSTCHSGNLMTDQEFHNLGLPQFGPGKDDGRPYDFGRYSETGLLKDRFAFRTPPLRNVTRTGPWMHNGAYLSLEESILHHLNPEEYLRNYDPSQLEEKLQSTFHGDENTLNMILESLDPGLKNDISLTKDEMSDLLSFLESLTDPAVLELDHLIPQTVPSGLPVERKADSDKSY